MSYKAEDVVSVRFNYPVYIKAADDDFDAEKLYNKSNRFLSTMKSVVSSMLTSTRLIQAGKVVDMQYSIAKPYLEKTLARNYINAVGVIATYAHDPNVKHTIPLAEIVTENKVSA